MRQGQRFYPENGKIETNTGDTIGKKGKTLDDDTITGGINWYYKNVKIVE